MTPGRRTSRAWTLAAALLWAAGCATSKAPAPKAVEPAAPSPVRRVAVRPFDGPNGPAVSSEFVRQLLAAGFEVPAQEKEADAVLSGAVNEFKPNNKLLVFLGEAKMQTAGGTPATLSNPVIAAHGTPETLALGLPKTQLLALSANVGLFARLARRGAAAPVWSSEFSYEAVDTETALRMSAAVLVDSLRRALQNPTPAKGAR